MRLGDAQTWLREVIPANVEFIKAQKFNRVIIPYLESPPGLGKTSIVHQLAGSMKANMIVLPLAQYEPTEVGGWHVPNTEGTKMLSVPPVWWPADNKLTFLFMDELPQAEVACQNVAAQLINERRVGAHILPDNVVIISAGNPLSSRAGTNRMPSHLRDRLTLIEIEPAVEDTVNYFHSTGINPIICAFLRFRPELLSKFDPDAKACPSPRSWERASTLMSLNCPTPIKTEAIAGQVGQSEANQLMAYLRIVEEVPDIDKCISDPLNAPIPTRPDVLYALAAVLAGRMDAKNAGAIITYLGRLTRPEFAAMAIGDSLRRNKALARVDSIREWALANAKTMLDTQE